MKKTGKLLKEARERQGISVNAVAATTKINAKVIEAMEAGNLDELPPKTFVRGFVQTYANFLKLDPKAVLDVFQEEMGSTRYAPVFDEPGSEGQGPANDGPTIKPPTPQKGMNIGTGGSKTKWMLGVLALLLFLGFYFGAQLVEKYRKESDVSDLILEDSSPTLVTATEAPSATPPSSPDPSPTMSAASQEPSSEPAPSPAPSPSAAPAATPISSPQAQASSAPEKSEPLVITLEALDNVDIEYSIDEGSYQKVSLEPEQKRTFNATSSFSANVSDGGAISIILNGRERGVPGNLGQPIKIRYPLQD